MKPLRILIADDHPSVRFGLKAVLEEQPGWKVVAEAENGQVAIEKATECRPDVAVIDLSMPVLGGLEAIKVLRREIPSVLILVLTMNSSYGTMNEALDAGAKGYLLKTDSTRMLLAAVEAVSESKTFITASMTYAAGVMQGDSQPQTTIPQISAREIEVLRLIANGNTSRMVAEKLGISAKTADVHRTNLMRRLNLHSTAALVRFAIKERIVAD